MSEDPKTSAEKNPVFHNTLKGRIGPPLIGAMGMFLLIMGIMYYASSNSRAAFVFIIGGPALISLVVLVYIIARPTKVVVSNSGFGFVFRYRKEQLSIPFSDVEWITASYRKQRGYLSQRDSFGIVRVKGGSQYEVSSFVANMMISEYTKRTGRKPPARPN